MTLEQGLALAIFVVMFAVIVSGKLHRTTAALVAAALTALLVLKSPAAVWHSINWETILFLGGMMVMVGGLSISGFFRWLCLHAARLTGGRVTLLFFAFSFLSGFLAMFIDSITVMLFLAAVTLELSRLLRFSPVPFIIALIFAANAGGAATMSGDPPNVIIGTAFGYSFMDFVVNTGPIAWVGMAVGVGFYYLTLFRPSLHSNAAPTALPHPRDAINLPFLFKWGGGVLLVTIGLLINHGWLGLSIATVGLIAAGLTLLGSLNRLRLVLREVHWSTLLFFLGLFVVVGGLEQTGVLEGVANYIGETSGGNIVLAMGIVLWFSAFTSAIVDNIPFAAAMVPVIREMAQNSGMELSSLSWALALGCDVGGNGTPIGASANVVGIAVAEREGHRISWPTYLKYAVPATVLAVGTFHLLLWLRYG